MTIETYPDYETLSRAAADLVNTYVRKKPASVVCLTSGSTPVGMFRCLVDDVRNGHLDIGQCIFAGLDEWIGIPVSDYGSCRNMIDREFFHPLHIPESQIWFFDAMAADPGKECNRINSLIASNGGLDIMLVGVGLNGHIAMNEPGTSPDLYAHVGDLAEETIVTGQKYFTKETKLSKGLTLGIKNFREAKLPVLMASGATKARIMKRVLYEPPTIDIPGSIVQGIESAVVLVDAEAMPGHRS